MIETIQIGHLLRETAASPYRNLVTRPTGAAVRNRIEDTLAHSDCLTALLDFSDVELLDFSCAEEIVAKLLLAQASGQPRFVVLQGLRDACRQALVRVADPAPDGQVPEHRQQHEEQHERGDDDRDDSPPADPPAPPLGLGRGRPPAVAALAVGLLAADERDLALGASTLVDAIGLLSLGHPAVYGSRAP